MISFLASYFDCETTCQLCVREFRKNSRIDAGCNNAASAAFIGTEMLAPIFTPATRKNRPVFPKLRKVAALPTSRASTSVIGSLTPLCGPIADRAPIETASKMNRIAIAAASRRTRTAVVDLRRGVFVAPTISGLLLWDSPYPPKTQPEGISMHTASRIMRTSPGAIMDRLRQAEGAQQDVTNEPTNVGLKVSPPLAVRFAWLMKIRNARELRGSERLHFELLAQERKPVAAGLGVQRVRRVVEFELFRLAHDLCILPSYISGQKFLLSSELHEDNRGRRMRNKLARIKPRVLRYERVEFLGAYLVPISFVVACAQVDFIRQPAGHQHKRFEAPLQAGKESANHRIVTVADVCDALRVYILARGQQIHAATHVHNLLNEIIGLLIVERLAILDVTRPRDRSVGEQ